MKNFFLEILKKLVTTILFAVLMFVASYCLMTGEFPPKIDNMKKGVANLQAQIQQLNKIRESQMAKLAQASELSNGEAGSQQALENAELKYNKALLEKVKELEERISRLEKQSL